MAWMNAPLVSVALFLVASGLSIIFGVTRIVNFAHGAFYMLGAYMAFTLTEHFSGALGFWGGMIQAVTHIAPGLNILLGLTFIVSFAGVAAPWAYIIGGIICLGVAVVLTQLAKEFTGAGGYFLYISRTFGSLSRPVGARLGWITTWLYFLYDPVAVSSVCAFTLMTTSVPSVCSRPCNSTPKKPKPISLASRRSFAAESARSSKRDSKHWWLRAISPRSRTSNASTS